ncbi:hypothetical protein [Methylobacterium sp. CM6246]
MAFWLGLIAGIGAVSLLALIALAVLLRGDVRAEDAAQAELIGEAVQ